MRHIPQTHSYFGYTLEIYIDDYAESPMQDEGRLGTFVSWDRNIEGDTGALPADGVVPVDYDKDIYLPVYKFEHSGVALSTTPFSDPWDSGQIGYIFVTRSKARKLLGVKRLSKKQEARILETMADEINKLHQWFNGEIWGYKVLDENGNTKDGCWGYYDEDECLSEARLAADYALRADRRRRNARLKAMLINHVPLEFRQALGGNNNFPLARI